MGFETAAAVAIGGTVLGGLMQADANARIADDQNKEARDTRRQAVGYAAPTPQEIQSLQNAASMNQADYERRQAILASADPAMIELGQQTLAMLRGQKEVGSNAALRSEFTRQRQQLEDKLRAQLGSGYATSSAGIQALAEFDRNQANSIQANQQQTLNSYLGTLAGFSQQGTQSNIGNASTLAQLYGNQSSRMANAYTGTSSNVISTAGAGNVGQAQFGNVLSQASPYFALAGMGGGAGAQGGGASPVASNSVFTQVMPG